jgi:hypothetical protein
LTLTGAIDARPGSLTVATPCGKVPGGFYVSLTFAAGSTSYALTVSIADYSGPQGYLAPPARISLRPLHTLQPTLYTGTSGRVVVNSDERSGTLSASLMQQSLHVQAIGAWACP